jgi:GT2 family glycosyltransferase
LRRYEKAVHALFGHLSVQIDIIHPFTTVDFKIGKGASYVRNYGITQVISSDMMCIDDDNSFDPDFTQKIFEYKKNHPDNTLIAPIQYDDTGTSIRKALANGFNFLLCRPTRVTDKLLSSTDRYFPLMLSSANCLVWSTRLLRRFPFDEEIPFVYEDIIMTGQMSQAGVSIYCDTWSAVIHAHGTRSVLAGLYINTPLRAYYKSKHRIILIHTIGSYRDKLQFYLIGLIGQTGWLWLHILRYAPVSERFPLSRALLRGIVSGIKSVFKTT